MKASEQLMPEADFLDLHLEFQAEDIDETTKDKDGINEYNFANTAVIDNDRTLVFDQHIVIPLDEFVCFINSNFVCHDCKESKSLIQHQVVGIAYSINLFCACRRGGAIKARLRMDDADKLKEWNETIYARLKKALRFDLNAQLVLGIQHMGCGERDASILAGMLNLAVFRQRVCQLPSVGLSW
jgi:hypothetical protein